jgi:hypothetical protein
VMPSSFNPFAAPATYLWVPAEGLSTALLRVPGSSVRASIFCQG